ncbi:hypothetical protein [Phytoactinopolyspora mesophila]|uniref:Carboxypeptidase regulatory-like domain-containing protein n=1 Tax=Phytoactinopolyspora mesophila TaxID=2650750 RepID=A0A7K3LZ54_9ACTN|nr:hypothetical protein [Phytoactinopolyspora mesophila]NDL56306.1 hypothetical protein [Phytoactinopolyspora mesophila]
MDDPTAADHTLLADLRDALNRLDPPPAHLLDAAYNSLDWMDADAALAELVADSAVAAGVAIRAAQPPRVLTFDAGGATLVVEILTETQRSGAQPRRRVVGQLLPPGVADVEVRGTDGARVQVRSDAHGRFRATDVPAGSIAFSCRFDDPERNPFVTRWTGPGQQ